MASKVVSVILENSITYVSGYVNGIEYTFTLTAENTWSAEVATSDDNIYRLVLTAIDNNGNVSTISTTLYYGLNLITDRTQGDVNRYLYLKNKNFHEMTTEEQMEWVSDLRGAYNVTDLSRVEGAMDYLVERLKENGYYVNGLKLKRLWNMKYIPSHADMEQYLDNVRFIRSVFATMTSTPSVPDSMVHFTYKEANDIEQILFDVDYLITEMVKAMFYSNDLFAGEV